MVGASFRLWLARLGPAMLALAVAGSGSACRPATGDVLSGGGADWTAVNERALQAVVRVEVTTCDGLGYGSGFYIDGGTVVSNQHVVEDASHLAIDAPDVGPAHGAEMATGGTDLAVISAPAHDRTLPLAASDPVPGDRIEVIGYPGGGELTVAAGRVVEIVDGAAHGVAGPVIYSDAHVRPGNSGGPMINTRGEVVGVVMALEYREGQGMAVPVSVLRQFLAAPKQPVTITC